MPPKFDMQAAREICGQLPKYIMGVCPSKEEAEAAKLLPAALDEIERMRRDIDRLTSALAGSGKTIIIDYETQAKRIAEYHEHERQTHKILGEILGNDTSLEEGARRAMRRIAELEGDAKNWEQSVIDLKDDNQKWREYNLQLDRKNRKQRAALQKLGPRSGKRGKALVEERAKDDSKFPELCDIVHDELMCPALDGDCEHWEGCPRKDELRQKARQQLRAEGLL